MEIYERYDLAIILGSQVKELKGQYVLAPHTELRARAAGIAHNKGIAKKLMISGGYNFWVRYDKNQILTKSDFSLKAFTLARREKSEAEVIRDFIRDNYGISEEVMFLEELSAYTEEQAEILKILLQRTTFSWAKKIAILTQLYHMKRALPAFQEIGLKVEPLFAEDLLVLENKSWIDKICEYYSGTKGGKQWPVDEIRELLSSGRSIGELLPT